VTGTTRTQRGILLPAVFVLIAFVILLGLGAWQIERLAWKQDLIAALAQRVTAPPVPLPPAQDWPNLTQEDSEFQRVSATVQFLDRPYAYAYTAGSTLRPDVKKPGYFVFAPARLPAGEIVVVNAGYVPDRKVRLDNDQRRIVGYLRWPEHPRWFIAEHDAAGAVWHLRDHRLMAKRLGWGEPLAPFYIDQESPVPPDGVPRPGPLTVKLRNDHLGYAITWFGLAAVLLLVFGFWAVSRGRRA
jgi:cytochrome oxidase assembly protein ShyY1